MEKSVQSLKNPLKRLSQNSLELDKPLFRLGKAEITLKKAFLLIFREIYLFSRNLLGLLFHPYKTLRAIRRENDFSQAFLLFSWPFPIWLVLMIFVLIIKFFFHPQGVFNIIISLLAISYTLFAIIYSLYIIYWLWFYFKLQRRIKNGSIE